MSDARLIYILSDSTGDTASRVLRAAMKQFVGKGVEIRRHPNVLRKSELRTILQDAAETNSLVAHTFAAAPLRRMMEEEAAALGLKTLDLLGPLLDSLEEFLHRKPKQEPGLLHRIDEQYFRRIDAVEFAVMHDDGKHLEGLKHADLVLVGVSRTGKTPLSVYLALEGWRVGNVPMVKGTSIPKEVLDLPKDRVVGLAIDPRRLADIRRSRMDYIAPGSRMTYDDELEVREEVTWSRRVLARHKIRMVDVTQRAIEETAHLVLSAVGKSSSSPPEAQRKKRKNRRRA
jgi:regulator of PEP synthase PpsR (kinase-PPPase family)